MNDLEVHLRTPVYNKYKQLMWQIDSGENVHICNDKKNLTFYNQ